MLLISFSGEHDSITWCLRWTETLLLALQRINNSLDQRTNSSLIHLTVKSVAYSSLFSHSRFISVTTTLPPGHDHADDRGRGPPGPRPWPGPPSLASTRSLAWTTTWATTWPPPGTNARSLATQPRPQPRRWARTAARTTHAARRQDPKPGPWPPPRRRPGPILGRLRDLTPGPGPRPRR